MTEMKIKTQSTEKDFEIGDTLVCTDVADGICFKNRTDADSIFLLKDIAENTDWDKLKANIGGTCDREASVPPCLPFARYAFRPVALVEWRGDFSSRAPRPVSPCREAGRGAYLALQPVPGLPAMRGGRGRKTHRLACRRRTARHR